jgi:hypothetical protein
MRRFQLQQAKSFVMKRCDLEASLLAEGCNINTFAVGTPKGADDAFCIVYQNQRWEFFYTERGQDSQPIFTSESEEEASEYFYQYVLKQPNWHLVGWFGCESGALELERKISALGAKPIRNDIPEMGGRQFRVFVQGKDIFPVLKAVPDLPILKDIRYPTRTIEGIRIGASRDLLALSKWI